MVCPGPHWPNKCVNDYIEAAPPSQCFDEWVDKIARQQKLLDGMK